MLKEIHNLNTAETETGIDLSKSWICQLYFIELNILRNAIMWDITFSPMVFLWMFCKCVLLQETCSKLNPLTTHHGIRWPSWVCGLWEYMLLLGIYLIMTAKYFFFSAVTILLYSCNQISIQIICLPNIFDILGNFLWVWGCLSLSVCVFGLIIRNLLWDKILHVFNYLSYLK